MAEVVVSPIVDIVNSKLTFLIGAEFGLPYSLKKGLEKLSITFSSIKLVLDDAEKKQIKHRLISVWLKKLRDAAYEAENILDDCALELQRPESQTSYAKQVSDPLATLFDSKQLVFRYKIGKRIKELRQKLDEFAPERHSFHLSSGVGVEEFALGRETSSFLTEPVIYGRVESRESILKILQHSASSQNCISICPILGIRGLGKTTLAQLIYNDEWVVYEFDTRIWISVSNDWSLEKITKMIIEFLSGKSCDLAELSPMQIHLKKLLTSKKFLLVLDDVRDDDREKWRKMTHLLTCGDKGSSVIVTTPLQTVVDSICFQTIVDSTPCNINPTLKLGLLSEYDCWLLFKQYAFGMEIEEITPNLIKIGKEIISKCGGLPLAVKALGSLLHSKSDEFWECARDSEIWNVQEHGGNTILPALRLSYYYLPPILRQCFAFCSLYPKDCEMEKIKLIHQWIANGFIQSNRRVEVETIGDEVFNELRRLSFFQDVNEGKYFKMHDLMHDLASSVMVNDSSITKIDEISNISQMAHHVSVIYESAPSPAISNTLFKSQSVCRTVLFIKSLNHVPSFRLDLCVSSLSKLKYLRVLDLTNLSTIKSLPPTFGRLKHLRYLNLKKMDLASLPKLVCNLRNLQVLVLSGNTKITTLPSSMGNLKQMRFLDLSDTGIILFPESIGGLSNLQTLNLDNCVNLKMLPKDLSSMRSLKKLLIDRDGAKLTGMPLGIGQLTCLKTLSTFVVSPFSDSAGIQELEMLNHLQGELTIKGLQHVRDPRDAQQANLGSKDSLSSVRLLWIGVDKNSSKEVLERLRPHANVQELFIEGYPGVVLPGWVGSSAALPKLTSLELQFMPNVEGWSFGSLILPSNLRRLELHICPKLRLPMPLPSSIKQLTLERWNDPLLNSVEALPNLSSLCVIGFDEVETFSEAPLQNLRSLETLIIRECYTLTRLPTELENLTTLRILKIYFCGGLESLTEGLRNLASLKELVIGHCQSLKSLSESSLQQLTTLETLTFSHCPNLEIISVGFQNLIALRSLTLDCLPQLTSLPKELRHSPKLLLLRTKNCKNLKTLPKWLLNLPTLYFLDIIGCHPELHKRCKDWTGAAHLRVVNEELSL